MTELMCTICGGPIKKGTCQQCGRNYSLEEIKTMVNIANSISQRSQNTTCEPKKAERSVNRIVSIHLNDLRVLYSIQHILSGICYDCKSKLDNAQEPIFKAPPVEPKEPVKEDVILPKEPTYPEPLGCGTIVGCIVGFSILTFIFANITSNIHGLFSLITGIITIFSGLLTIGSFGLIFTESESSRDATYKEDLKKYNDEKCYLIRKRDEKYNKEFKEYSIKLNEYQQDIEEYNTNKQQAISEYNEYINGLNYTLSATAEKLSQINTLLENTANVDIVPNQYRNIESIYYLHNYISSSDGSLKDALIHFDLGTANNNINNMSYDTYLNVVKGYMLSVQDSYYRVEGRELVDSLYGSSVDVDKYSKAIDYDLKLDAILKDSFYIQLFDISDNNNRRIGIYNV